MNDTLHDGERAAQHRFGMAAAGEAMSRMLRPQLTPGMMRFIEAQPFFFIATSGADGSCDCSFRGRQHRAPLPPDPALAVLDERTIVFPDYQGNNLYNSIGNILVNPHIGLLFVDFSKPARLRVNGRAELMDDVSAFRSLWPDAKACVRVSVVQAFPNCSQRIPVLVPRDLPPTEETTP